MNIFVVAILIATVGALHASTLARDDCEPYSKERCEEVANAMGFELGGKGYEFAGDYNTKGCYGYEDGHYAKRMYYGEGGTEDEMKEIPDKPKIRPDGYDCNDWCTPFSENTCKKAAEFNGLVFGSSGDYGVKGCYAYDSTSKKYGGKVYFGTGGDEDDMKYIPNRPKYRPTGYDCMVRCSPYSEQACRDALTREGLEIPDDDEFIGDFGTKGCYYYKDHATYGGKGYYGTDGTEEDMQAIPDAPKYRPDGYDCNLRCSPYSQSACEAAAEEAGLELGSDAYAFVGDYTVKGCYAYDSDAPQYAGQAYYGTGGDWDDMDNDVGDNKFRPTGYDCA